MNDEVLNVEGLEEILADIKQARILIRKVKQKIGIPQLERCLYNADIELHWACWNLGYVDEIVPDCE